MEIRDKATGWGPSTPPSIDTYTFPLTPKTQLQSAVAIHFKKSIDSRKNWRRKWLRGLVDGGWWLKDTPPPLSEKQRNQTLIKGICCSSFIQLIISAINAVNLFIKKSASQQQPGTRTAPRTCRGPVRVWSSGLHNLFVFGRQEQCGKRAQETKYIFFTVLKAKSIFQCCKEIIYQRNYCRDCLLFQWMLALKCF